MIPDIKKSSGLVPCHFSGIRYLIHQKRVPVTPDYFIANKIPDKYELTIILYSFKSVQIKLFSKKL